MVLCCQNAVEATVSSVGGEFVTGKEGNWQISPNFSMADNGLTTSNRTVG